MDLIYELLGKDMRAFQGSVGKTKKDSGHSPGLPVAIVPGLCSSALSVEAGYNAWIGSRIWLSVSKMGLERLRWGNTRKSAFLDPLNPPLTPGMILIRHGLIFTSWQHFWVFCDAKRKTLFYFKRDDVRRVEGDDEEVFELQHFKPKNGATPCGSFTFDHRTTVSFSSSHPRHTDATKCITLKNQHTTITWGMSTDGLTDWRYIELFSLLRSFFPEYNLGKPAIPIPGETDEKRTNDSAFNLKNLWLKHMMLDPSDGVSDPPNVRVRAEEGVGAIDFLDPGTFVKDASYVFGPVLANLRELGYTDDMLAALSYDWRLPPYYLQQRDGFFWKMKATIEKLSAKNDDKPVVILAHSLGNCVTHYFLSYILHRFPDGQSWLDRYVHTFFAVGAPWLGAPKSIRGLVCGDKMGLDAFMTMEEARMLSRSWASAPWLFPTSPELHFRGDELKKFAHLTEGESIKPMDNLDALIEGGATQPAEFYQKYYAADPLVTAGQYLEAPTVKLFCLYGVNLDTEVTCLLHRRGTRLKLDKSIRPTPEGYRLEDGVVYETNGTVQTLRELAGSQDLTASGDGTVPYASLAYPHIWKMDGKDVHIVEIDGAPHREVLEDRTFLAVLLDYVSKPIVADTPEQELLPADPQPEVTVTAVEVEVSDEDDKEPWMVIQAHEEWQHWPEAEAEDPHGLEDACYHAS